MVDCNSESFNTWTLMSSTHPATKTFPKEKPSIGATYEDIDTSASYAFILGNQIDSLEEISEHLSQEKTITDERENWIPIGDVYRHPKTSQYRGEAIVAPCSGPRRSQTSTS